MSYAWRVNFKRDSLDAEMVTEVVICEDGPASADCLPSPVIAAIHAAYERPYIWSGECVGPVVASSRIRQSEEKP